MYIPAWLLILGIIVIYWFYKNSNKGGAVSRPDCLDDIEGKVFYFKDEIFKLEHFNSPHFIDAQNNYDIMEVNYLRLKERYAHMPDKLMELAQDWLRYVEALRDTKQARVMLDVDFTDDAFEHFEEASKQPTIITEEIEKKFKTLLGKDWQKLLPNFFERRDKAKPEVKKKGESLITPNAWKIFYSGETNLEKMEKLEKAKKETQEIKA